jgi:hypothetical protein
VIEPSFAGLVAPIDLDAQGTVQADATVVAGAASFTAVPASSLETCNDWAATATGTVRVGDLDRSSDLGFGGVTPAMTCMFGYRVYCLEQ